VGVRNGNLFFVRNTGTATSPAFAAGSANPFGLLNTDSQAAPRLVDIDGDGDIDVVVGGSDGDVRFFRNTGNAASPAFAMPALDPFGLAAVPGFAAPAFADIDGDGDADVFIGDQNGDTHFQRNIGTAVSPAFGTPTTNKFLLSNVGFYSMPAFADIDGDGDFDALFWAIDPLHGLSGNGAYFFRNTGTHATPEFALRVPNPFGLANLGAYAASTFVDIDGDGDLDMLAGTTDGNLRLFRDLATQLLFEDSFDSGNLTGWSGHAP
jgi:hypothetical protein